MINFITDHPILLFIMMFIKLHPIKTVAIFLLTCIAIISKIISNVPERY